MIALTAQNKTQLEKALARAEKENLSIVETLGTFDTTGACGYVNSARTGGTYCVIIARDNGQILAQCTCEGAERGLICKHVGLVAYAFKAWLLERRAAAERAEAVRNWENYGDLVEAAAQGFTVYCGCGAEITNGRPLCATCQLEKDRADIFG